MRGLARIQTSGPQVMVFSPAAAATTIKRAVPKAERRWDADCGCWRVTDDYLDDVTNALASAGFHVRRDEKDPVRLDTRIIAGPAWPIARPDPRRPRKPGAPGEQPAEGWPRARCPKRNRHPAHGWPLADRTVWCRS